MTETLVFVDIDTQVDFMLPSGSLYVPGAEAIVPNLRKLFAYARENQIPILSSADAHPPNDASFAEWPPHCVVGTPGQRRIPETQMPSPKVIPNRPGTFTPPDYWSGQTIIEKADYDVSTNPNFEAVLASLGERRFVVFGVATEYCVRAAALALRKRGKAVDVVTDAIRGITPEGEREATKGLQAAGVGFVKTAQVCVPRGARRLASVDLTRA